MRFEAGGKIASFSLGLKVAAGLRSQTRDNEGLIDHLRAIHGVIVAVFSKNCPKAKVRVGMRSKSDAADVCAIGKNSTGADTKLAAGSACVRNARGRGAENRKPLQTPRVNRGTRFRASRTCGSSPSSHRAQPKHNFSMSLTATPDGVLLVDKATGMTSHDVVAIVRRRLQMKKVGHCGTLDPIATGLLLLTLGRGTKIQDLLMSEDKEYVGTMVLGITTDARQRRQDG